MRPKTAIPKGRIVAASAITPEVVGTPPSVATLSVRVVPRSSKNAVAGIDGSVIRIRLTAPPVDGKANEALVEFLSDSLDLPKRSIGIVSGETGRTKIVRVDGIATDAAISRLATMLT